MDTGRTSAKKAIKTDEQEEPPGLKTSPAKLISLLQVQENGNKLCSATSAAIKRSGLLVKVSKNSKDFCARYYPATSLAEWSDWHWQLRNTIRSSEELSRFLHLSSAECLALSRKRASLPLRITPYYMSLLDTDNSEQAVRRAVVPNAAEFIHSLEEAKDPLAEDSHSPVQGIVHRYPDRVLFLATTSCLVCCRYCTRSRAVGNPAEYHLNRSNWEKAIEYINASPQVRDVLISGGDPLELSDEALEWILSRLSKIKHVEIIRIGTKAPAVLPQRITSSLIRTLKKYHPLWMSLHFTHPAELTPETTEACARLADAGIPLGSQTVLLKGINDKVEVLKPLFQGLLRTRVRPYYLYQCDPILGSAHFRTPVEKGIEIIEGLRGHTSGYAVPSFVIDAPDGGGKIPLLPEYYVGRDGNDVLLRNYENKIYRYPDPA